MAPKKIIIRLKGKQKINKTIRYINVEKKEKEKKKNLLGTNS